MGDQTLIDELSVCTDCANELGLHDRQRLAFDPATGRDGFVELHSASRFPRVVPCCERCVAEWRAARS